MTGCAQSDSSAVTPSLTFISQVIMKLVIFIQMPLLNKYFFNSFYKNKRLLLCAFVISKTQTGYRLPEEINNVF